MMKRIVLVILALLATLSLAGAQSVQPSIPASTFAHPALWHVRGESGEVYLLGAVHVLPPGL
ncbi:MAG: hypothetical protein U1E93_06105 [Alphaproteobacteria bacterium]